MLFFLDKIRAKKEQESPRKEKTCTCGEVVETIPGEKKDIFFCRSCNKLLYFVDAELELPKILPLNLGWLKKK